MSANVLLSAFKTEISCSEVWSDGYEAGNLISSDQSIRRKGFLAESFIKPPVNIYVKFKYPLELSHIILNGRVGSQKSIGFEIYSQINQAKADIFYPLAKTVLKNDEDDQVTFINPNYISRPPFINECKGKSYGCGVKLRHNLSQALTNISKLQIRITRTLNSCIPALGKLEIWAQPSPNCSKEAALNFSHIYKNISSPPPLSNFALLGDMNEKFGTENETSLTSSNETIPSEFIDTISCEIMTLPVLLPSGHSIDQTTLDKYVTVEATWGRSPNDPFTGVPFTAIQKPLPNSALKGRIDTYLLIHQNIAKGLPRTIGRKRKNESESTEFLNAVNNANDNSKRLKLYHCDDKYINHSVNDCVPPKYSSHEENLKKTLDLSLKKVLFDNPLFTRIKACEKREKLRNKGFSCPHEKAEEIYKLPCKHVICRFCLIYKKRVNKMSMECDECHKCFHLYDPIRIHL